MKLKQISSEDFFSLQFPETKKTLSFLEKMAKSDAFLFFSEEQSYPGMWRADNDFIYFSGFKSHKITHFKLHEMLSKSSGIEDGWLPFVVSLKISKKERTLMVFGYGGNSPGSFKNFKMTPDIEEKFLSTMKDYFQEFNQWVDLILIIDKEINQYPKGTI